MIKRLLTVIAFLAASPVVADGILNNDGYATTVVDGTTYYMAPATTQLFTREVVTTRTWTAGTAGYYYYSGCCRYWYPGTAGYWTTSTSYKYTPLQINLKAPNAEEQLIAAFKARDQAVLAIVKYERRLTALGEFADKLGMNAAIPNYGAGMFPLANYGGQLVTGAIATGNTAYGYQTLTLEAKGIDDQILAQALAQAQADGGMYLDRAHARLSEAEARRVVLASRAYQTLVQGQAAAALATATGKAVQPKTDIRIEKKVPVVVGPPSPDDPIIPDPPAVMPKADERVAWLKLSGPSQCVKCHAGDAPARAQFDITTFNPDTADEKELDRVWRYITSNDPKVSCGNASGRTKLGRRELGHFAAR